VCSGLYIASALRSELKPRASYWQQLGRKRTGSFRLGIFKSGHSRRRRHLRELTPIPTSPALWMKVRVIRRAAVRAERHGLLRWEHVPRMARKHPRRGLSSLSLVNLTLAASPARLAIWKAPAAFAMWL